MLSAAEKFTYLQALLEGKARDAIAGLPLTEVNYTVAIGLLERIKRGLKQLTWKS